MTQLFLSPHDTHSSPLSPLSNLSLLSPTTMPRTSGPCRFNALVWSHLVPRGTGKTESTWLESHLRQ